MQNRWRSWHDLDLELLAPALFRYEVTNGLYRSYRAGDIDANQLRYALRTMIALPIRLVAEDDIHERAAELAGRFNLPATYDAHYLIVAQDAATELWTADKRLFNTVQHRLPWVRLAE